MPSHPHDHDLQVIIEPVETPGLARDLIREVVGRHDGVVSFLDAPDPARLVISDADVLGRDPDERATFEASVFDPATNRAVHVRGRLDRSDELEVSPSAFRPNPTRAELRGAAAILRRQDAFPDGDDVVIYAPMPPLADLDHPDGTSTRRPTLGVYNPGGSPRHRIVAVDSAAGTVDWAPTGVDAATDDDCEAHLPEGVESMPDTGGRAKVRVRVLRGGVELWNLIVVRPRDSAPQALGKGSGVELRKVHHRGRSVLSRAHVPILNVLYDDGITFRDWQNQETPFHAAGSDPVGPGFRLCSTPPATILEAGDDAGNFQGVAFHYEDGELRIVSEVQAGWYRYVSEWRLRDDGVIKPRFGFAGTRNPRTCMRHQHHVYWRLDFDIDGAGGEVVEQRGVISAGLPAWTPIVRETKRRRGPAARSWRVRDKSSGRGYRIVPGPADGTADAYGVADLWLLRYGPDQYDDGVSVVGGSPADTQVRLDKHLSGQSIDGQDVVVWYAGHFVHDEHAPSSHQGHIVGPDLIPL
jgi:hypothetical protein